METLTKLKPTTKCRCGGIARLIAKAPFVQPDVDPHDSIHYTCYDCKKSFAPRNMDYTPKYSGVTSQHRFEQDSHYQIEACPPGLGFDVVVMLNMIADYYNPGELETSDIICVYMDTPAGWIDIFKCLPPEILDEIVEGFNAK